MATIRNTADSVCDAIVGVADAATTAVTGSAAWLGSWSYGVQQRAETERLLTRRIEEGRRNMVDEIAAMQLVPTVKAVANARMKDTEAFDAALKLFSADDE